MTKLDVSAFFVHLYIQASVTFMLRFEALNFHGCVILN